MLVWEKKPLYVAQKPHAEQDVKASGTYVRNFPAGARINCSAISSPVQKSSNGDQRRLQYKNPNHTLKHTLIVLGP